MTPANLPFWDAVDRIRHDRPRYAREAYGFVVAALGATVQALSAERLADPLRRHLSGPELLRGMIAMARDEFGLMAPGVFREWRVLEGEDVGRIVFELILAGQLSARPEDRLEDFAGGPDLLTALGAGIELGDSRAGGDRHPPAVRPAPGPPGAPSEPRD